MSSCFIDADAGPFERPGEGLARELARNGMAAIAQNPALPDATPGGPLSAQLRRPRTRSATSAIRVRREKAALSSGCKPHPATAPAGSNRSSPGGDEVAGALSGAGQK